MKKRRLKRKEYIRRVIALFLAVNILAQVVSPGVAFALTTGPSQPEVQSFEPIEANTMVSDFTGDFNYNIPLLTVPGPNGGYPINMSYHAGVTMDQEASWVGLGWNINPGVVTRNMRGIPDDFSGDGIIKEMYQKPQRTYSIGAGTGGELQGAFPSSGNLGAVIRYDNYKGVTLGFNHNLSLSGTGIFNAGISTNYDPQSGIGLNPSVGIGLGKSNITLSVSGSINSRNGLTRVGLNLDRSMSTKRDAEISAAYGTNSYGYSGAGAGTSFGSASMVPNQNFEYNGSDVHFLGKLGGSIPYFYFPFGYAEVGYKQKKLVSSTVANAGYGYLYYENNNGNGLYDFNRDNNGPVSYEAPALEIPIATYDVYAATGQGVAGTFRPFRSDIGVFHDPSKESSYNDVELGADLGLGITTHIGANLGDTYSKSYSGMWKDEEDVTDDLFFSGLHETGIETGLFVPHTYFKAAGELTANTIEDNEISKIHDNTPLVFDIKSEIGDFLGAEPHAKNLRYGEDAAAVTMPDNHRSYYEKRDLNFHYRTFDELSNDFSNVAGNYQNIYDINENPAAFGISGEMMYGSGVVPHQKPHHLGEVSVYKNDGMKYVYGLPVYNTKQHEYLFNLSGETTGENGAGVSAISGFGDGNNKWAAYDPSDAGKENGNGEDEFYSKNRIPPYVHSYMLTAIFSPDYVDLTGNGPSDDDFGYYVKFNYSRIAGYKWRTPLVGAKYEDGYLSHGIDQKGTFMYGEKDVYYLNSVETKSHIALFTLSDRKDSKGPASEHVSSTSSCLDTDITLKRLAYIKLYSKQDLVKPIKCVYFKYDYSLCKNVLNNSFTGTGAAADSTGKLTLKKVFFAYEGSTKGIMSPYEFSYTNGGSNDNPDYDPFDVDRWGNFKPQTHGVTDNNLDNPYTDPYTTNNDTYAAAWNLKSIVLPSGAKMKINYEADDYAYVQNKRAMQMCVVTGTGNGDCTSGNNSSLQRELCSSGSKSKMDRVYFKLLKPTSDAAELDQYFEGLDNLFFKVYTELKEKPLSNEMARDYVEGYCKIEEHGFVGTAPYTHAWVQVKFVPAARPDDDGGELHPFRRAAFEYMKLKRPDLFFPPIQTSSVGAQLVSSIVNLFTSAEELIAGYYHTCVINGYAKKLFVDQGDGRYRPSFIRLNNPYFDKVGGGHRVSKIEMDDNWNEMDAGGENATYGQEYKYVLADGKSSGVAEYEPLIGGEENPWKQPSDKFAAERKVFNRQKELYSEEPYGEALFPGANVGYSRVVIKNIDHGTVTAGVDDNAKTESGISVKEFYTAKDFPIRVTYTEVKKIKNNFSFSIPFIGSKSTSTNGFSQGFTVELNDMHGKPKSEATYSYAHYSKLIGESAYSLLNQAVQPVSKTSYIYNTTSPYNPNISNTLNNRVPVMEMDGVRNNKLMGHTYDFNVDMNENSEWSLYVGDKADFDLNIPTLPLIPAFWFSNNFSLQYSDQMSRTIVSSKVIMQNGILKEIKQLHEGSASTTRHLIYDSNTGAPILTTVTNEFDKPIYNYEYKANWYYPDMKNNGSRYRYMASGTLETVSGQDYLKATVTADAATFIKKGDLLYIVAYGHTPFYGRVLGNLSPSTTTLKIMPETMPTIMINASTNAKFTIIKPIESNQQSVSSGFITSLSDPTDEGSYSGSILDALNDYLSTHDLDNLSPLGPVTYIHPCTGEDYYFMFGIGNDGGATISNAIYLYVYSELPATGGWDFLIPISGPPGLDLYGGGIFPINDFSFYGTGANSGVAVNNSTQIQYPLVINNTRIPDCTTLTEGVLRASSTTFRNTESFDYTDIGNPDALVFLNESSGSNSPVALDNTLATENPYRFGQTGVWRVNATYTFLAQRGQSSPTDISKDGTVGDFRPFNWEIPGANHPYWARVNNVSRYSPYGFELENQDVLGNYSSALYGYNNQLPVSICSNTPYYEQAYDGFEDYPTSVVTSTATPTSNHGHFRLYAASGTLSTNTTKVHTGKKSLDISGKTLKCDIPCYAGVYPGSLSTYGAKFNIPASNTYRYTLTYWVKAGATPAVSIAATSGTSTVTATTNAGAYRIEGWQRMEHTIEIPSGVTNVQIQVNTGNLSDCYIDDIRVQPFKSAQKTFVYNPVNLWLMAELDERNFATFYNYDEEGALTQVKKETINGISTIKSVRKNTYNH